MHSPFDALEMTAVPFAVAESPFGLGSCRLHRPASLNERFHGFSEMKLQLGVDVADTIWRRLARIHHAL